MITVNLFYNMANGSPLEDIKVRQAIDKALDFDALAYIGTGGYGTKSLGYIENSNSLHTDTYTEDEKSLDMYEGYHEKGYCYYDKEQIPVKFENGIQINGMVYIMDKTKDFGFPSYGYYQTCLQGYKDCGLDTNVLEEALKDSMKMAREQYRRAQEAQAQNVQEPNEIQETQERQEALDQMKFV